MKKLILSISLLFTSVAFAAAPSFTVYPFMKKVQTFKLNEMTTVQVPLTQDMLQIIKEDYSNFQLTNDRNEEVEFFLQDEFAGQLRKISGLTFSSSKGDAESNLIDGDELSSYAFDERVDGKGDSWVIFDLGQKSPINQIEITPTTKAKIRFIEIKAGNTKNDLKTIVAKKNFQQTINLTNQNFQFFKVSLWGISVKIQDIKFWSDRTANIFFEAEPDMNYQILYGNEEVNSKRYVKRNEGNPTAELVGKLSKQQINPNAPEDIDEDGVLNTDDNCVTVSNKRQKDRDNDRVGDKCDNAPDNKNYEQTDTDKDGVGNIIDNCPTVKNIDQKDKDGDGKGDACDFIKTDKDATPNFQVGNKSNTSNGNFEISGGLIGGLFGIIAIAALGFFVRNRKK